MQSLSMKLQELVIQKRKSNNIKAIENTKDVIRINCTWNKLLKRNMPIGISNMEYIFEMMLQSGTCVFCVYLTIMLIQITSF